MLLKWNHAYLPFVHTFALIEVAKLCMQRVWGSSLYLYSLYFFWNKIPKLDTFYIQLPKYPSGQLCCKLLLFFKFMDVIKFIVSSFCWRLLSMERSAEPRWMARLTLGNNCPNISIRRWNCAQHLVLWQSAEHWVSIPWYIDILKIFLN